MRGLVIAAETGLIVGFGVVMWMITTEPSEELISRPWTRAEISDDGQLLTLWIEPPGDRFCEVFDHIEVERVANVAVAAALYRRTDQEFCQLPCPGGDVPHTAVLDEPLTGLTLVPSPDAVASCRT
jgi:hypothetical protein